MGDCCLNILITFKDQQYNYTLIREYNIDGSFNRYYVDLDGLYGLQGLSIYYNEEIGVWEIYSELDEVVLFTSSETVPLDCPSSNSSQWIASEDVLSSEGRFPFTFDDLFLIYEIDCDIVTPPSPSVDDNDEPVIYCRNKNLFKKQKAKLSKDIAAISKREVFGFDCGGEWENLFMRSLIIDALSCPPYGVISDDTERCLIGKLNEKCNC